MLVDGSSLGADPVNLPGDRRFWATVVLVSPGRMVCASAGVAQVAVVVAMVRFCHLVVVQALVYMPLRFLILYLTVVLIV